LRLYEGMFIIDAGIEDSQRESVQQSIEDEISKQGGEIVKKEPWGVRSLAYSIKKRRDGFYWLIYFKLDPSAVVKIGERFKLNEAILRCMFVIPDKAVAKEVGDG